MTPTPNNPALDAERMATSRDAVLAHYSIAQWETDAPGPYLLIAEAEEIDLSMALENLMERDEQLDALRQAQLWLDPLVQLEKTAPYARLRLRQLQQLCNIMEPCGERAMSPTPNAADLDADYSPIDNFPRDPCLRIASVRYWGIVRYGRDNHLAIPVEEHLAHAMEHVRLYRALDRSEDHLAHAAVRLMLAMHRALRHQH